MQALGVHHVSINVDDVDAALAFYVEALGMAPRADRPDFRFGGAWLDVGQQQVHLIEAPLPGDRGQHFALAVADLDATVAELCLGVRMGAPRAVAESKRMMRVVPGLPRDEAFEQMRVLSDELFSSDDGAEGMASFAEKRKPRWQP